MALQATGSALVAWAAGCSSISESPSTSPPTDSATLTDTPTSYPFEFIATVENQASDGAPPRFRALLTNIGSDPLDIGYGQELLFSALGFPDGDADDHYMIVPTIGSHDRPAYPIDDCWQWGRVDDSQITPVPVHAIINWNTLSPGESLASTYEMYSKATNETCFLAGEFVHADGVYVGSEDYDNRMSLRVGISISKTGAISVDAEPPVPP